MSSPTHSTPASANEPESVARATATAAPAPARAPRRKLLRAPSFAALCAVMALETIAANMVHPVEPAFYIGLGLPAYVFGVAYAAMALGVFLLAPFWGVLSDRVGRVPVLAATTFVYGCAQLLFVMSTTVGTIVVARFLAGAFCSGCMTSAMAYVADTSGPERIGRRMAVYGAVLNLSTALGFLLGGVIGAGDPRVSFVAQFFVLALAALAGFALLVEGEAFERSRERISLRDANPLAAFVGMRRLASPWMIAFLAAAFGATMATEAFTNAFNYYLRDQFAFSTAYNGAIYAVTGVLGFAANLTIGMRLQRARHAELPLAVVLAGASVVLLVSLLARSMSVYLGIIVVFFILNAMFLPLMQALVVQSDGGHGELSGLFQSTKAFGGVVGALAAGFVYAVGPTLPFVLGAVGFAAAAGATTVALRLARARGRGGRARA
ncbi:MFS transporter [bacterium]|nr:MFS transporter [bacterium]